MSGDSSFIHGPTDLEGPFDAASRLAGSAPAGPVSEFDISAVRHPYEPSRFALALVGMALPIAFAIFVLVSLGEATTLVVFIVVIGLSLLLVWLVLQLWRVRLLGDAVLVSEETLPEFQEVIDTARSKLGYDRPLRVFVVDKMSKVLAVDSSPITFTQFFGIRVLIAEGAALGDLADAQDRQRLLFAIATYIGALKARYARWWSPLFTAFHMTGLAALAQPLINPYYRATVFSGDRIAYSVCGDLDVSLEAVYRALVGKEIAPHLRAAGLTAQALTARRRKLLRLAQLLRPTPHATNRYLELLAFIHETSPEEFDAHRSALGASSAQADSVLASMRRRQPHDAAAPIGIALAAMVLIAGLSIGLTARNSPIAEALAEAYGWTPPSDSGSDSGANADALDTPTVPQTLAETNPTPTETDPTTTSPADPILQDLLTRAGADPSYRCTPDVPPAPGALAAVTCHSLGGTPELLGLEAYETSQAMRTAIEKYAGDLPGGSCVNGEPAQTTWTRNDQTKGPLACYLSKRDASVIIWGSDDTAVLAYVSDPIMNGSTLYQWWSTTEIKPD